MADRSPADRRIATLARIRDWWDSITLRGRGFLLVGLLTVLASQFVGERDLIRIGLLVLALPLVSLAVVIRTRYRLRLVRSLAPTRVEAGSPARVLLRLENVSRLPSNVLLMEDTLPLALGGRPRFVLRQVEPTGVREATYAVHCEQRGAYEVGPLTVRLTDPFGCVELTRAFSSRELLMVTPATELLPPVRLGGDWHGGGDGHAMQVAITGEADVATREYRQGDDLRKVHWKATAKRGELMVRRDEQPRQNRATVLLDTRRGAHRGDAASGSFEWCVSAAASAGTWLARRGYTLRLATTGGAMTAGSGPAVAEGELLDALAVVQTSAERGVEQALRVTSGQGGGGLVVAVLGVCDEAAVRALARVPSGARAAVAVIADAAQWSGTTPRNRATAQQALAASRDGLLAAGWRVVVASHGAKLADLWPEVGRKPFVSGMTGPGLATVAGSW